MPLPPPPPPAPPPPPPPVVLSAPPAKTKDRAALLNDIHKGKNLRKVVTNDRSSPLIDGSKSSGSASAAAAARPAPSGTSAKSAPVTGSLNFADELSKRLGGGGLGRNLTKNSPEGFLGSHSATNGGSNSANSSTTASPMANGVSRPLPPPPPMASTPSLSSKPVQSQVPKQPAASTKPTAPQPGRVGATANGVGKHVAKGPESSANDDGRFKGPSVKDQMKAFANVNHDAPPPPPVQALKKRLSKEHSYNEDGNDDGAYATKAAPPPPPTKPPSKPPQKDSRFHTLKPNQTKHQQQYGNASRNIPRSGSHENLPTSDDSSQPPAPPPKLSTVRSPGSAARPAPPPPARPLMASSSERPQVAPPPPPPASAPPPPPPPPAQKSSTQMANGPNKSYIHRNNHNDVTMRSPMDNLPAPPPRRESLMPDLERRFNFLALHELPPPEEFRNEPKIYPKGSQPRRNAPEPPAR